MPDLLESEIPRQLGAESPTPKLRESRASSVRFGQGGKYPDSEVGVRRASDAAVY